MPFFWPPPLEYSRQDLRMLLHWPPTQKGKFIGQVTPQPPQFLASALTSLSQPFALLLSQLAKPGRHESSMHRLFTQMDFALGMLHCGHVQLPSAQMSPMGHALPQAPQLFASPASGLSQPLAALPSQSPKLGRH